MRAILIALLLVTAGSAWADWVKVAETGDTAFYVEPASIDDKGNHRRASVVQDYAAPEPGGIRSRQVRYEIDCSGQRLRSLSATEHSEPMARGRSVNSWERESEWLYVAPRTGTNIPSNAAYRAILRFVCGR